MEKDKEIEKASQIIKDDSLVIFPTETAYGIACDVLNPEAIDRVYEAKRRPREKGLTVIVSSLEQAERYARLSEREKKLAKEFMPGPLTLVSDKKEKVPDNLNEKFVFRISSSDIARKLAEDRPITATSANISGNDTSYSVEDISPELREKADQILDVGELDEGPTSTIVEVEDDGFTVHRAGPIKKEQIEKVLER